VFIFLIFDLHYIFLLRRPILNMSFLGGAECSTAGNPLTQFTKHVQNDNTLQRDRLVGRGPGGLEESMRSRVAPNGSDQVRGITKVEGGLLTNTGTERVHATACPSAFRHGADATWPARCTATYTKDALSGLVGRVRSWPTGKDGGSVCVLTHEQPENERLQPPRICSISATRPS
jgi:hypothetical protein